LSLNYGNDDQFLNSLRASRDLLKIFLKTKK
jgi:sRNA-binding regulator protein Hfq